MPNNYLWVELFIDASGKKNVGLKVCVCVWGGTNIPLPPPNKKSGGGTHDPTQPPPPPPPRFLRQCIVNIMATPVSVSVCLSSDRFTSISKNRRLPVCQIALRVSAIKLAPDSNDTNKTT